VQDQPLLVRGLSVGQGWGGVGAYPMLGVKPAELTGLDYASLGPTTAGASPLDRGNGKPWHPDNGVFWVMAIAAVTLGLIGVNGAIRVGDFKAAAGAGKT
jgi:hypothetical protein